MAEDGALVLLVDDDEAVRESLKFALELEGLHVTAHESAEALLAQSTLAHADCLILDYKLQGMDGFALIDRLAARKVRIPTVLITSHADPALRARAKASKVRFVLEKPLADAALAQSVRTILAERPPFVD